MSSEEMVQLHGLARGEGLLLAKLQLKIEGSPLQKVIIRNAFDLELEEGRRVRVEAVTARLLVPAEPRQASYGELAGDPRLAAFDVRPGPHVAIELEGAVVRDGDRVAVRGRVERRGYAAADYRSAPAQQIEAVEASEVACGPEPERRLTEALVGEEKERKARRRAGQRERGWVGRHFWSLVFVAVGLAALAVPLGPPIARATGAALVLMIALFNLRRGSPPAFHPLVTRSRVEDRDPALRDGPAGEIVVGSYMVAPMALAGLMASSLAHQPLIAAGILLAPALLTWRYLRPRVVARLRRLRAMLAVAPLAAEVTESAHVAAAGVLRGDGGDPLVRYTFTTWMSSTTLTTGGSTTTETEEHTMSRTEVATSLAVHTPAGEIGIPIVEDVLWASTSTGVRMAAWEQSGVAFARFSPEHRICRGDQVLVVGRLGRPAEGAPTLVTTGPESVLLFASGARDPRQAVRREILLATLTPVLFVLLAALPAVWPW